MFNIEPITLLNTQVVLTENSMENIMEIAKIPEELNESRLSSLINFIGNNPFLAGKLTVQERYYLLLNYFILSDSPFSSVGDCSEYFLPTDVATVPNQVQLQTAYMTHLYGNQAALLEKQCENAYDWLCGQIALQCFGDLSFLLGDNNEDKALWVWEKVVTTDNQGLSEIVNNRYNLIKKLTPGEFTRLTDIFYEGGQQLVHFVELGLDNKGITLAKQDYDAGDGTDRNARFCPFDNLPELIKNLARCVMEGCDESDGTRENEHE